MFSPIGWIKPRLRPLCVAFGVTDMTLVIVSTLLWYFIFDSAFEAQHIDDLFKEHGSKVKQPADEGIRTEKDEKKEEELRLRRTMMACGIETEKHDLQNDITESNYAGPAALIGAAMGGFFVLGALLATLNTVNNPMARKVVCNVALFGEGVSCFFLLMGVAILSTTDGLCRVEYYFETFQPVMYLSVFTLMFICTYKTYEMTIIVFCLGQQSHDAVKDLKQLEAVKKSGASPPQSRKMSLEDEKEKTSKKPAPQKDVEAPKDKGQAGSSGQAAPLVPPKIITTPAPAREPRMSITSSRGPQNEKGSQNRSHRKNFKNVPENGVAEEGSQSRRRRKDEDVDGSERSKRRRSKDSNKDPTKVGTESEVSSSRKKDRAHHHSGAKSHLDPSKGEADDEHQKELLSRAILEFNEVAKSKP